MKPLIALLWVFLTSGTLALAAKPSVQKPKAKPPQSPAISVSQSAAEIDGVIQIFNTVSCDSHQSNFCQQTCKADQCQWSEVFCRDCFSSGSIIMQEIFVRLLPTYRALRTTDDRVEIEQVLSRFFDGHLLLATSTSPYDFYNSSKDPSIAPHLVSLCGSPNGFVGVSLDMESRPSGAVFAVCSTPQGLRATFVELNKEFSFQKQ